MSIVHEYLVSTRSHGGGMKNKVSSEWRIVRNTVENKIKDLSAEDCFNIVLRAREDDSLCAHYQIPVYFIREHFKKGRKGIDLKPWTDQLSGSTTLDNILPRRKTNWERFVVDDIDQEKRYEINSLSHLFVDPPKTYGKKLTKAAKFRIEQLEPIQILEEEEE